MMCHSLRKRSVMNEDHDEHLPKLEDRVNVVTVVEVDEGEVHETFFTDDRSESDVFVVVGEMIFRPILRAPLQMFIHTCDLQFCNSLKKKCTANTLSCLHL